MKYPSWSVFEAKYQDNPQGAFEALCRLLFRTRYGIGDSLPYFYNNAGNETVPVSVGKELIGFQAKYFSGQTIDDSQASQIKHSIKTAHEHYPKQTKIIVYTNLAFGNPPAGKSITNRQKGIEKTAKDYGLTIEWVFGDNILDIVSKNDLAYNLFFNIHSNLSNLPNSVAQMNDAHFRNISDEIKLGEKRIKLDRGRYIAQLKELLHQNKNVVITGESGSGKSAIVKEWWNKLKDREDVIVFFLFAQQFRSNLADDVFSMDERYGFADFKNFFAGFKTKILVVDSAEKLLEIDSPIKQIVLGGLAEQEWQFVFTCKCNAAEELENQMYSFSISTERINVEILQEDEINKLKELYDLTLPTHDKVRQQIRIPFYLARYCELNDKGITSTLMFRERVWNQKVRGLVRGAEQQKREECLMLIVKEQQEKGVYIANPEGLDYDMAYKLVGEDVLVEHPHKGYSVKHDLYTDWALDYAVDRDFANANSMECILASEPVSLTYANSFRRWLDRIIDKQDKRKEVVVDLFLKGKAHQKWEHHILACIGASEQYASVFFQKYDKELCRNDYSLFDKLVEILYVACQEVDQTVTYKGEQYRLMKPAGSGWDEAVLFIYQHQDDYYMNHLDSVYKLLYSYSRKRKKASATRQAGLLSLRLYQEIAKTRQQGDSFWLDKPKKWSELICKYASYIQDELKDVFRNVAANRWTKHTDPYAELVEYILKQADTMSLFTLCLCCNDGIVELLKLFWTEQPVDDQNSDDYYAPRHSSFDRDYVFGLNSEYGSNLAYFPNSALQTPIFALLSTEHLRDLKGTRVIDFVIDFMNVCVDAYSQRDDADLLKQITVELPDGHKHEVLSSQSLWNLYRGTSNISTPNLLESMHMAVESFLLSLVDDKKEAEWGYVRNVMWRIIYQSKSVSLYAIAASLAVAYPMQFYDILLFLCQDIRFISMDLTRCISEHHATSIEFAYRRHPFMLDERKKSNKLPHRQRCLETTLFDYQVEFDHNTDADSKEMLTRAYDVVDKLRKQKDELNEEDSTYKFIFERIDYRSMKKEDVDLGDGQKGTLLIPNSTPEMEEERAELQAFSENMDAMSLKIWADKKFESKGMEVPGYRFDKDVHFTLNTIIAVEKQVNGKQGRLVLLPGDEYAHYIGSAVLLMFYADRLSSDEQENCWRRLMEALCSPKAMLSNCLCNIELCISAIPAAIKIIPDKKEEYAQIITAYCYIKEEYMHKRLCDIMSQVIVAGDLWNTHKDIMERALEITRSNIPERDYTLMDEYQSDTVLCLLTYKTEKRELGRICVEKLSNRWRVKKGEYTIDRKKHESDNIAMYLLFAPKEEVRTLIAPYIELVGRDHYEEPLMTSFLLCAAQYEKYDNFWIVWNALYSAIINQRGGCFHDKVLYEYLFNPWSLMQDSDNWFHLEEKDLQFFEKVANDIGGNPVVIHAFSRVFATIGKEFQKQAVGIFSLIVSRHPVVLKDEKSVVVRYLEKIVKNVASNYATAVVSDPIFKNELINVLEYLRDNGSTDAQTQLNNL